MREYESTANAARRTGTSRKTIERHIDSGALLAYRFGPRLIRVAVEDVDALMRPVLAAGASPPPAA